MPTATAQDATPVSGFDDGLAHPIPMTPAPGAGKDRALVLSGGGIYMTAFEIGYLGELIRQGVDLSNADVVVGTSSRYTDLRARIPTLITEARPDAADTLICFFSDHGDHLGDHRAWQKESFFEAACRVPLLVSWPARLPADRRHDGLAALTDLFGLATAASGAPELRDGVPLLEALRTGAPARDVVFGVFGTPGTRQFKCMVRRGNWKYLWLANGGRELLFHLVRDPGESRCFAAAEPATLAALRQEAIDRLAARDLGRPALENGGLKALPFEPFPRVRIKQFARGVTGFGQPAAPL